MIAIVACCLGVPGIGPAQAADPCHDPTHPEYRTHACKVTRLRERPWVVIATVDGGINPYHLDFRLADGDDRWGVHPSEYISGYPSDAEALEITLEAPSQPAARALDREAWDAVEPGEMRWIPGTNIIAGVSMRSGDFSDVGGHGTAVASITGGRLYGRGGPNVLIVSVEGTGDGWRWAAEQPWIDLISVSWSSANVFVSPSGEASYAAAAAGKLSCVATGNLVAPLWVFKEQGPSWNVNVGAVDTSDRIHAYSGSPADVVAVPDLEVATPDSMTATRTFGGTSGAAPHVCASIGRLISEARGRVGDAQEGPHGGGLVVGTPGSGPFSDGVLNRAEIERAVQATARSLPGMLARSGYGVVEPATVTAAQGVLFGEHPWPDRPVEDAWIEATDAARDALYGPGPDGFTP